jgi:hypothetical protein
MRRGVFICWDVSNRVFGCRAKNKSPALGPDFCFTQMFIVPESSSLALA